MEIIIMLVVVLASYALGRLLARFFFGFVFDKLAEINIHLAMGYLVLMLVLLIVALVYAVIQIL